MMALVLAMSSLLAAPSDEFADLFEADEYRYTGGRYENELCRYRLFVPPSLEAARQYPLILWLHGYGERGSDNKKHLRHLELVFDDPTTPEKYGFFMLAIQCTEENATWFHSGSDEPSQSDEMITVAMEILQKTMREHPVDPDRVYLAGVSTGGSGCWEAAMRYPGLFAAVVPMASSGGDLSRADRLVNTPIWAFHSRDDAGTPPEGVQQMVEAVKKAGGSIHLTLVPTSKHNCWPAASNEHRILQWMLVQRRGTWINWTPPGSRPWRWWHLLAVPTAIGALVWLGWLSERKRRRRIRVRDADPSSPEISQAAPAK